MINDSRRNYEKIKICVSGAEETSQCGKNALDIAKDVGRQIVDHDAIMVSPSTPGFSLWATMGAKEAKGTTIGFSPAATAQEHTDVYRLPLDYLDMVVYTGFGIAGRDLLIARSCDAMIFGCGRMSTYHEFAAAFQEGKPIGVLEGNWHTDEVVRQMMGSERATSTIFFDEDPRRLVERLIKSVHEFRNPS